MLKIYWEGGLDMSRAKASLMKSASGFFLAAICIMYPQQIGGFLVKVLGLFSDIFAKIFSGAILKAIGL